MKKVFRRIPSDAAECEKNQGVEHRRRCAEACRRCAAESRKM